MTSTTTALLPSSQEAAKELLARREARKGLLPFTQYVWPEYEVNWHHRAIAECADMWLNGAFQNLMVFTPAQHGKSEIVSRKLPAFTLGRFPDAKYIAASYAAELIQGMNRDVQRTMETPQYKMLFPGTRLNEKNIRTVTGSWLRNNDIFEVVNRRGSYRCAGIGGGLSGFPCDYGSIDDPFADYKQAASKTVRDSVWEWYTSVFLRRCHKLSCQLITQTRWHEDDLAGRLLEREPERWAVLKLTGIKEPEFIKPGKPIKYFDLAPKFDSRANGEALWGAKFDIDTLNRQRQLNPHQFEAMTQQNPTPREGAFFKPDKIETVELKEVPGDIRFVTAWDIGATEGDGDPSANVKMGTNGNGLYYIMRAEAKQKGTDTRDEWIKAVASDDGKACKQRLPQDPGAAGKSQAAAFIKLLAGFTVLTKLVSGDKVTRADPFSSQVNAGNVRMVEGEWNSDFREELRQFPNGKHDDMVDAGSDAFDELAQPLFVPFVVSGE